MTRSRMGEFAALLLGLLALGSTAHAGRGIRVDVGSDFFYERGEAWVETSYQETFPFLGGDPFIEVRLPFAINYSGDSSRSPIRSALLGTHYLAMGSCPVGTPPFACGDQAVLFPWLADSYHSFKITTLEGRVDREKNANGEYDLADALRAVQFRWFDRGPRGAEFDYQIILFDVSDLTGVPGDFDVEVNFGYGTDIPLPAGEQSLWFGPPEHFMVTTEPAKRFTDFCFRSGALNFDCAIDVSPPPPPPPPPTTVPTPGSVSLAGLALVGMLGARHRRRRLAGRAEA